MALITPGYLPENYTPDRYIQEYYFPEYGTYGWRNAVFKGFNPISGEPIVISGKILIA